MVWGGIRAYTADHHADILSAVSNFTTNNEDTKAALIPTFNFIGLIGLDIPAIIVFFFYDGASPANGIFDEFESITALFDETKSRTYEDLTKVALAGDVQGFRFQIRENTFPNLPPVNMSSFFNDHFSLVSDATGEGSQADPLDIRIFTFTVQPLPRLIAQASTDAGGNALGLTPDSGDRVWIEYDLGWASPGCDDDCPAYVKKVADAAHDMHEEKYGSIEPTHYESGDLNYVKYLPQVAQHDLILS